MMQKQEPSRLTVWKVTGKYKAVVAEDVFSGEKSMRLL
jgi:hypothetical protein